MTERKKTNNEQEAVQATTQEKEKFNFLDIPLEEIEFESPFQQRKVINHDILEQLKKTIPEIGVDPIKVMRNPENGKNSIVDGGHRFLAAKELGMKTIPAIVIEKDPEIISLIHNIVRKNFDPLEEAYAIQDLVNKKEKIDLESRDQDEVDSKKRKNKQKDIAEILGRKQSYISESLKMLKIKKENLDYYINEIKKPDSTRKRLSKLTLMKIADIESAEEQKKYLEIAMDGEITANEIGELVEEKKKAGRKPGRKNSTPAIIIEKNLESVSSRIEKKVALLKPDEKASLVEKIKSILAILEK